MSEALARRRELYDSPIAQLERIIEIRHFEDAIDELGAQGQIHGVTHTCQGQEAVAVGVASVLKPTDYLTCTYRSHGYGLALGVTPVAVMGEILGRSVGAVGGLGGTMHLADAEVGLLPTFAIVGAGIPVAVGTALSALIRGSDQVGVAVFGDGASNIGAFHEGLNLAAIWNLPVVFVCENNIYGEYSRFDTTTPISDVARRADSYGIRSRIVDGQDLLAVQDSVAEAVNLARTGQGPSLLEMKTYRYRGHSRGDAAVYRPPGELEAWLSRDPITIMQSHLEKAGQLDTDVMAALYQRVRDRIEETTRTVMTSPRPEAAELFAHVWATRFSSMAEFGSGTVRP